MNPSTSILDCSFVHVLVSNITSLFLNIVFNSDDVSLSYLLPINDKMTALRTETIFHLYGFCICMDSAFFGQSTSTTAFDGAI